VPALPFLDTNIILRHLTQDHADHSPRATAYFARIEQGELEVYTADTVIFESMYTLERVYRQTKAAVREGLLPLIELNGIILPGKPKYRRVFDLYVSYNLSFGDAYHVGLMESLQLTEMVSFDQGLDRIPTIQRIEP
jgi:predicted nucleic acid-binding protein